MSNPVFMAVCLEGERTEVRSLYGRMKRLQERKKPLVDKVFRYLSAHFGIKGIHDTRQLWEAIGAWEEANDNRDSYIIVKKIEVQRDEDLWDYRGARN